MQTMPRDPSTSLAVACFGLSRRVASPARCRVTSMPVAMMKATWPWVIGKGGGGPGDAVEGCRRG